MLTYAYRDKEAELACAKEEEARWRRRELASSQALAAVGAAVDAVANARSFDVVAQLQHDVTALQQAYLKAYFGGAY